MRLSAAVCGYTIVSDFPTGQEAFMLSERISRPCQTRCLKENALLLGNGRGYNLIYGYQGHASHSVNHVLKLPEMESPGDGAKITDVSLVPGSRQ